MIRGRKRQNFAKYLNFGAVIVLILSFFSCSQGPSEDDLYTVFISYGLAEPTTESLTFENGSITEGVIVYNFDNVIEESYGYTFDGLVRDTFTSDSHSYWGMLTCTGGIVTNLYLNYETAGGSYSGSITGDNSAGIPTAIDLSTLDFSSLNEDTGAEE